MLNPKASARGIQGVLNLYGKSLTQEISSSLTRMMVNRMNDTFSTMLSTALSVTLFEWGSRSFKIIMIGETMIITLLLFNFMMLLTYYFRFMRSSYYISTSFLFYYKNLIKKKSKLNLLYINKKCNIDHPRLKPIAISFLLEIIIFILSLIIVIISAFLGKMNEKGILSYFEFALVLLMLIVASCSMIYCEISNKIAEKKFENYSQEELNEIRNKIENEWPNFFKDK